jgi:hypothetical protein
MGVSFDDEPLSVDCDCGASVATTIGAVRKSPTLTCAGCGTVIKVDGSDLDRSTREAERAIDDFERGIGS